MKNESLAYYLKYRPQTLEDLLGQDLVKKTLTGAFLAKKLSHAYLFVGPRGTGKTSTARILAKMVNCGGENAPCNKCSVCLSIANGSNMDLIEIDAASNRGIEDIRALRDKIKLAPSGGKKKVYIIDEVHMLTSEAFNALLKTLEEPPVHALFILATTEGEKIPQTIISRVQRLDFKLATSQQLLEALRKIVDLEKIDIDDKGLKLLVKSADGSFRDGVKLLDQVSSLEGKITPQVLERFLKTSNFETLLGLIDGLGKKDTTLTLSKIVALVEDGADIKELTFSLMDLFRQIVFIKNNLGEQLVKENYSEENYQSIIKISESFTNGDLIKILDSLQKALEQMKITSIPSLPLELAVVEICSPVVTPASLAGPALVDFSQLPGSHLDSRSQASPQSVSALTEIPSSLVPSTESPASENTSLDIQKLKDKWTYVLETIRPYNFSLEALLRSVNITECSGAVVYMEVPYSFHQRILEAPKNRDLVESILSEILGRQIRVSTVLGIRQARKEDVANIEIAQDDEIIRVAAEIFNSDVN